MFTGKPVSQTTGLYYYGARWYDPSTGRFISQDPLAGHLSNPQTLNPYVYVTNTPTTATDLSGELSEFHDRPYQPPTPESVELNKRVMFGFLIFEAAVGIAFTCVVACPAIGAALGIGGGTTATTTAVTTVTTVCTEDEQACQSGAEALAKDIADLGASNSIDLTTKDTANLATGRVAPSQIGDLGVKATINSSGENFIGTEGPVLSENYGFGRIDVVTTDKFIEVKNVQSLYLSTENELQLLKYVDAVGANNLQYDIYSNFVHPAFYAALNNLGVSYRVFPYIPVE